MIEKARQLAGGPGYWLLLSGIFAFSFVIGMLKLAHNLNWATGAGAALSYAGIQVAGFVAGVKLNDRCKSKR